MCCVLFLCIFVVVMVVLVLPRCLVFSLHRSLSLVAKAWSGSQAACVFQIGLVRLLWACFELNCGPISHSTPPWLQSWLLVAYSSSPGRWTSSTRGLPPLRCCDWWKSCLVYWPSPSPPTCCAGSTVTTPLDKLPLWSSLGIPSSAGLHRRCGKHVWPCSALVSLCLLEPTWLWWTQRDSFWATTRTGSDKR